MKRFSIIFALALAVSAWAAPARADLKVVATTPDLAAVARAVGGDHVDVTALALHTQDPHFVDPRPHLMLDLSKADMLLLVGLDLEVGWLPTLLTGSRNGDIQQGSPGYVDCSQFVSLRGVPKTRVDRSMGDIHPGGNPHYMFDPRAGARVASGIADKMAALDPDHAERYVKGAKRLKARLAKSREKWEARVKPLRGARVIAYHRSFTYLADWLGYEVVEHLEPKPGIPPNPRHVAGVITKGRKRDVKLLLQESFYPDNTSSLAADKMGVPLVTIPGGPDFRGGQSYVAFIDEIVRRIAKSRGK